MRVAQRCDIVHSLSYRVRKLPEENGFFREEWKKLEKRYFFQFLPEKTGRNWKKLEETGRNVYPFKQVDTISVVTRQILVLGKIYMKCIEN